VEFEIDTARQQLNLQFGTRDLMALALKTPARAVAAGCLLQYERYPAHCPAAYPLNHHGASSRTASSWMPRRAVTWRSQNLAGGVENTLASVLDSTVTPMGSRMLKRWLHMRFRNTETLTSRQQTIAALQDQL
jgi:DNA mismatch repair protein MutS